jgi:multiple RNA-binding domain-containing protein 1
MEKYKDDRKFQEFLRIHKRNSFEEWNLDSILNVGKEFENQKNGKDRDDSELKSEDEAESESDGEPEKVALKETVSDLDYLKSMTVKKDQTENEEDAETDAETDEETEKKGAETKEQKEKKKKEPKNEKYFDVKLSNLPFKTKKKEVKNFLKPLKPKSIRVPTKVK